MKKDEAMLWGLWGGVSPGGWCSFRRKEGGYRYAGTRDEALTGKAVFNLENDFRYDVVPFDPEREPQGKDAIPTSAQAAVLRIIEKDGTINNLGIHGPHVGVKNWRATVSALYKRGWYTSEIDPEGRESRRGMRLTKTGRAALARYTLRNGITG
jgi:hypothetical protein